MTPDFRILAERVDVTDAIRDRLLELVVVDEAGTQSDEARLVLDDRRREDGALAALPGIGARLDVALGYAETGVAAMGVYRVDEIEIASPPATLSVVARAADMSGPIRSPRTRSWDGVSLGGLVRAIAAEHRLTPMVDPDLAAIELGHVDQTAESDLALLTRLALAHDAVVKPAGDKLVLVGRGRARTAGGATMPRIVLRPADVIEWRYRHSARRPGGAGKAPQAETAAGGVKAYYWDFDAGARREVVSGQPPYTELRHVFASKDKALAAARAGRKCGERAQGDLSLSLPGDPRLAAEARLSIDLRPGIPSEWRIKRVEHRLGAQGYTTQVECERFID